MIISNQSLLRRFVRNVPFGRHGPQPRAQVLGHKMEIQVGKHRFMPRPPPRIPKHPTKDANDFNMKEVTTYADLKLRWKKNLKPSRKNLSIKRKWKVLPAWAPRPEPTCLFIHHERLPHRSDQPMLPPPGLIKAAGDDIFAVMKSSHRLQHKVTVGDIIQTERMHRRQAGDKVVFGTVLLVGGKDFTIIGKPTVPYAKVHCVIEQQTLSKEVVSFYYKPRRRMSRFMRVRHWVTMLRVVKVEVESEIVSDKPVKPKTLLDLWANRWLTAKELLKIECSKIPDNKEISPLAVEHQPGTFRRRGLVESYRFNPDPEAPKLKHF